ncbi:carboxylesterase family protein [Streptomyces sp. NBC_01373]|uniref:carboxylesterase family protein n=1 Tax=Streptomyces sp. NBC_01373 TaxID=2903843 RepID=UPI00224EBE4A|nr:carboxylesterase family protein [Streptomyces sp. NBC_01373]MCX4704043.1 carboxylesterase family protein [Streptomyces sp. NBC_01373]
MTRGRSPWPARRPAAARSAPSPPPLTSDACPKALTSAFGDATGAKADAPPAQCLPAPGCAYAATFGDQLFACPALRTSARLANRGQVYAYEFADRTSPLFASLPHNTHFDFGATHAAELNYLFKPYGISARLTTETRTLAGQNRLLGLLHPRLSPNRPRPARHAGPDLDAW